MSFDQHSSLPPHLPTICIGEDEIPPGWRRPSYGEVVRSYWEAYVLIPKPGWRLTAYRTSDGYVHQGLTHYRVPASLKAWLKVLPQMARRTWRSLTSRRPKGQPS